MPHDTISKNNNKPLRILVLATSYPLGPGDSSSVFLRYLCDHLHRQGAEIHVLAPASLEGGEVIEDGIQVHRFRYMFRPWQKLSYGSGILPNLKRRPLLWFVVPFFMLGFALSALRLSRKIRPDVLHGHWVIPTGVIALLAGKVFRIPYVLTAHGGDAFLLNAGPLSLIKKIVVHKASAWTANTNSTANAITSDAVRNGCRIIPMGVDTELFKPVSTDQQKATKPRHIIFVGRLVEKKGVGVLLRAVSLLPEETRSQIVVDIIGEGIERSALINQARETGIESIVNFVGFVPNTVLPRYLVNADIFVGPTFSEGQGVVFLEAMACGLPVIASDVGGVAEVIDDGVNGILVPPGDAEGLSKAINGLLFDDARQSELAKNGLQVVQTRYTWDSVSKQYLDIYKSLIA